MYCFFFGDVIKWHDKKQLIAGRIYFGLKFLKEKSPSCLWHNGRDIRHGKRGKKLRDFHPLAERKESKLTVGQDCAVCFR